jgi:hypothetical protein
MDKGVNNMKKYELTNDTIEVNGKTFYRIRALKDFGNIEKGELGGYVESENILSQEGNCWIYGGATVANGRTVTGDTEIHPLLDNDEEGEDFNDIADAINDLSAAVGELEDALGEPVSIEFE